MGWKVEAAADDRLQGGAVMSTRVLAVDKHVAFRHDLALYLTLLDQGYEVIGEAGTAADALARVAKLLPDIVLIDIDLPDSGGLLATRQIRAHWPRTKVIVIGNDPAEDYRQAALQAGAIEYVDKLDLVKSLPAILAAATQLVPRQSAVGVNQGASAGEVAMAQRLQARSAAIALPAPPAPFDPFL